MKTRTKALLLALSAVLLVVSTVFATMAYLTSKTDVVKNTFTVGKVNITLDEAKVDEYGVVDTTAGRVLKNTYKLIPGHTYVKDPTVHVKADSEDCYVRMMVTLTLPKAAAGMEGLDLTNIFVGNDPALWTNADYQVAEDADGNVIITYQYRYTKVVDVDNYTDADGDGYIDLEALFTKIAVPGDMEVAVLEGMKIDVVAHAIQADGFADRNAAWAEWDE